MITATPAQKKAIMEILDHYDNKANKKLVWFIAPTGAGKTFIIANVISEILKKTHFNQKIIFIIFTLSNAELPKQFRYKLNEYKDSLEPKYEAEYFESPSKNKNRVKDDEGYIKPKNKDCNVFIFGTQSFGKGTTYSKYKRFDDFIQEKKDHGFKIIYIRDEAHIGDTISKNKKNEGKEEQKLIEKEADFIIKMTATPDDKIEANAKILVNEKDLVYEKNNKRYSLLKNTLYLNRISSRYDKKIVGYKDILDKAIEQFKQIKRKYREKSNDNKYIINPCMLIQIDSINQQGNKIKEDCKDIDEIVKKIEKNNLTWVIYLANRKESSMKEAGGNERNEIINLKSISANDSNIDVVILKIGPTIGWDIPRACMLVQLRKVSSSKLNKQTIGRVRRNPNRDLVLDETYQEYWIYSDNNPTKDNSLKSYSLKESFKKINFPSFLVQKDPKNDSEDRKILVEKLKNFFEDKKNRNKITKYSEDFKVQKEILITSEKHYNLETFEEGELEKIKIDYEDERLKNAIQVRIHLFKVLNDNFQYLDTPLKEIYDQYFYENMYFDLFRFIFFQYFWSKLSKKDKSPSENNESNHSINYKNVFPEKFYTFKNKNSVNIKEIKDIYPWKQDNIYTNNKEKETLIYLDSSPEKIFLDHLIFLITNNKWVNKFDCISRIPSFSLHTLDYFHKGKYNKSYFDFLIKFKNEDTFLFIEVKSVKDYNEEKTKYIEQQIISFQKSINNPKNINVFFIIVKIDEKNSHSNYEGKEYKIISINEKEENFSDLRDLFVHYFSPK